MVIRIAIRIANSLKEKYKQHAKEVYGLSLSAWARMLMAKDYRDNSPASDED